MFFYVHNENEKKTLEKLLSECRMKYSGQIVNECEYSSEEDIDNFLSESDTVEM